MSNAAELLTKSSYCRNSKHAKCKTAECGCKCHAEADAIRAENAEATRARTEQLTGEVGQKFEKTANVFDGVDLDDEQAVDNVIADVAVAAAEQAIADRLDPAKAQLSNAHKRAIRVQMVAYLNAMPVELSGDLEGVTPEEAAAYVDTYWVKYIDPARDKARHTK